MGMDNSLRNNNDGYTYFGFQEDLKNVILNINYIYFLLILFN